MNAFMYQFKCPGQIFGNYEGVRNIYTDENLSENDTIAMAKKELRNEKSYENCSINLLVKYKLSIDSVKTYSNITKIPFSDKQYRKNED